MFIEPRKKLIGWLREQLIGPPPKRTDDGPDLCSVLPTERFPCGALYPTSQWGEGIDPASEDLNEEGLNETESVIEDAGGSTAEPAMIRRYIPPSSLGLSFFIKGDDIRFQVLCHAVRYESIERDSKGQYKNDWTRRALVAAQGNDDDFENIVCPAANQRQSFSKLDQRARVDVLWRRHANGWIVTVSLCNAQELADSMTGRDYVYERAEKTLFEASLCCVIDAGEVGAYPRVDRSLLDQEEQEIELQYAHRHIYAIGHGCAANWDVKDGKVAELSSETMPAVEVPRMTGDTGSGGEPVLSLARLVDIDNAHATLLPELGKFISGYAHWVDSQQGNIPGLSADDCAAADRIVGRMNTAVSRMRVGLRLLGDNAQARLAFSLANRAMLDQMRQHDRLQDKPRADDACRYRWRPFQLGFLLATLESTANEDSEFRDTVDLIWFPTGGGKTEAYLGLIAFQIVLRRLRYSDTGGGTAILMRYTLRLLTRDQFIRATRLICALELIRRERGDLGTEPISIGLWVGQATSPNTFNMAAERVNEALASDEKPELVLGHCPWCGQDFAPGRNYDSGERHFHFLCRNQRCGFGASGDGVLPCNVVDEALYAKPPTMLVATVDKFARLAWEARANAFFGGSMEQRPPELIIQDELHLIAGALGSVAGLYEAAIDTVLQLRGVYPKYIASTATIRMAEQQIKRLYGREVAVFPPPGLDCDDSYFARTVPLEQRPGRIYVGYLAPMLNRQRCMAPLAAALLLAPQTLFEKEEDARELLDAWWTQVVYHGSIAGVGNSHTAFESDVRDFMRLLLGTTEPQRQEEERVGQQRSMSGIAQLTSRQTAAQNAAIFARLSKARGEEGCLDAVLATSMISVGLDVARLALMIINGQPLTTAEYIQASSRVGRGVTPGLVFVNYYRAQARSLSHYESFRPYHEAFYRFVEPTSVTPYTYQARLRALPAALVIVMRHAGDLLSNDAAGRFDRDGRQIARAVDQFKQRCAKAASGQTHAVCEHIDALSAEWQGEVERCRTGRRKLEYQVFDKETGRDRLLYNHDDRIHGLWPALQSLRNVENTALLKAL